MVGSWTIEVGGTSRKYRTINFERKLITTDSNSPTEFSARVEYSSDIDFMNRVEIKRYDSASDSTTIEWTGYVERRKILWDSGGRFLELGGRDASLILWKKYIEDFSNFTAGTAGFFGRVNAAELILFLLRSPYSDPVHNPDGTPSTTPNNKEGWGIDSSKLTCNALAYDSYQDAYIVAAVGDPQYTVLRKRGLGWQNSGVPFATLTLTVNGSPSIHNWTTTGASPYLDNPDSENHHIKYTTGHDGDNYATFDCQDSPADLTTINSITLNTFFKIDGSWWWFNDAYFAVWIWVQSQSSWIMIFDQTYRYVGVGGIGWTPRTEDITKWITTKSDLDNIKIKITASGSLSSYIGYTTLVISYARLGTQTTGDYFEVAFPTTETMGIYIESRMNDDSFPRHYEIVSLLGLAEIIGAGLQADFRLPRTSGTKAWTAVDPDTRLVANGGTENNTAFLFHSYSKETTKNYQDYSAGGLGGGFFFENGFKVNSSPTPSGDAQLATIFCVSDTEGTRSQLDGGSAKYVALDIDSTDNTPVTQFKVRGKIVGSSTVTFVTGWMNVGTQYYFHVTFSGGNLTITIDDGSTVIYTNTWAYAYSLRYLYDALTWGATETFSESIPPADIDTDEDDPVTQNSWTHTQDYSGHTNPWTYWLDSHVTDKYIGILCGPAEFGDPARFCYPFKFNPIKSLDGTPFTGGTISSATLKLRGQLWDGGSGHWTNASVRPYVSIDGGSTWHYNGGAGPDQVSWSDTPWTDQTIDMMQALSHAYYGDYVHTSIPLENVGDEWKVVVRLEWSGASAGGDENHGGINICWQRWTLSGMGTFDNTGYNGDIQFNSIEQVEQTLIPDTDNTGGTGGPYRDLIHSWQPVTLNNIRIRLTDDDATHSWTISQIYVYMTQPLKYRPYLDGLSDPTTTRPTPYAGGPYIKAVDILPYATPVGPLNVSRQRLLDAINFVVQQCYETEYIPYEWWVDTDSDNTFYVSNQKGSDRSATVTFQTSEEHGGVTREQFINDTVQRVYVVGEGEQKTAQNASTWVEDTEGMDDVRTFYEDIDHEKNLTPDQKGNVGVAKLIGEVYIKKNYKRRDQIDVTVNKDDIDRTIYPIGYDVGDIVTIIDALTGITGTWRIFNIDKNIDSSGEVITLHLGYPRYRFEDEVANIYKQLKMIQLVGVLKPDWTAEGIEQAQVDASAIGPTSQFEASAKNEEADTNKDIRSPSWDCDPVPSSSDYHDYDPANKDKGQYATTPTNGMEWHIDGSNWMALLGCTSGGDTHLFPLRVAIIGDQAGDTLDIPMNQDPKTVFEIRYHNDEYGPDPKVWDAGDVFKLGIAGNNGVLQGNYTAGNPTFQEANHLIGFYFFGYYTGATMNLFAMWSIDGVNVYSKFIRTLNYNHKYRLEIVTQSASGIVMFNVYDIEGSQADEKNPVSVVAPLGATGSTITVKPLYMYICSRPATGKRAVLYLYRFTCEWIRVLTA